MRPFSALYYIRENKGRSFIVIFMFFLTMLIFIAGNYISSLRWFWDRIIEYDRKTVNISALPSDEDFADYASVLETLGNDKDLELIKWSTHGYGGLSWKCTLGFEMGSVSFCAHSVDDMKRLMDHLGIECDMSRAKPGSIFISKSMADNTGHKIGDIIKIGDGEFCLDGIFDDEGFAVFLILFEQDDMRTYVISNSLSDTELRSRVESVCEGKKVKVGVDMGTEIDKQFEPFDVIFMGSLVCLSIVLAVPVNSVLTGQYMKRTYEFGIYRAIGIKRRSVFKKVFCEIMTMDAIAIVSGILFDLLLTFLLNELLYIPDGKYLPYASMLGLEGVILSNLLVLIPSVIFKGRMMLKADVTEF